MLKFSDDQYLQIQGRDSDQFVRSVCDQFMESRPDKAEVPGRVTVCKGMREAFDFGIDAGFKSTPHLIRLMYLSADIPGIPDDPAIRAYLLRPGATSEQRLDDLLAVVDHKLKGMK